MNKASLIGRIKKLLALSQNNPNIHEAEAAMAKAQEMIARYNISEAFLKMESGDDGSSPILTEIIHKSGRVATWVASLANVIGKVNGCAIYISRKRGISCVGEEDDIALVRMLTSYLQSEIIHHCKAACAARSMGRSGGRVFANRFKIGAVETLSMRLLAINARIEAEVTRQPNGSYAIAIISNKMVRAKKSLPQLTHITIRHRSCIDGYQAGQRAGKQIRLKPETSRLC